MKATKAHIEILIEARKMIASGKQEYICFAIDDCIENNLTQYFF